MRYSCINPGGTLEFLVILEAPESGTQESLHFKPDKKVKDHFTMKPLMLLMSQTVTLKPYWLDMSPVKAGKSFEKYGVRSLLYIMLNCTVAKGNYLNKVKNDYIQYRRDLDLLWRNT